MSSRTHTLEGVAVAIDCHRQSIAKVLDHIEELQRHAVERYAGSPDGDARATGALFAYAAQRLRAGDEALRDVVLQLCARVG